MKNSRNGFGTEVEIHAIDSIEQNRCDDELRPETVEIHSFSRVLASDPRIGVKGAIILKYFAHRISKSSHVHFGKRWFYCTLEDLCRRYPYLSKSAIDRTIKGLSTEEIIEIGRFNRKGFDRTRWFSFKDSKVQEQVESEPIYFSTRYAPEYGIVEAVLLQNIAYWIQENRQKQPEYTWHGVSATKLTTILPFTKKAILNALRRLEGKELQRRPRPGWDQSYEYRLLDEEKHLNARIVGWNGAKRGVARNGKCMDPKWEMDGPKSENA
jgi:hypothetical protein